MGCRRGTTAKVDKNVNGPSCEYAAVCFGGEPRSAVESWVLGSWTKLGLPLVERNFGMIAMADS